MSNYLLAFHGGGMPDSEQARASSMAAWGQWYEQLGTAVIDGGNPVAQASMISADGTISRGGGPNPVSGYTLIEADNMDDAVRMSQNCPIFATGGSVEVAETLPIM